MVELNAIGNFLFFRTLGVRACINLHPCVLSLGGARRIEHSHIATKPLYDNEREWERVKLTVQGPSLMAYGMSCTLRYYPHRYSMVYGEREREKYERPFCGFIFFPGFWQCVSSQRGPTLRLGTRHMRRDQRPWLDCVCGTRSFWALWEWLSDASSAIIKNSPLLPFSPLHPVYWGDNFSIFLRFNGNVWGKRNCQESIFLFSTKAFSVEIRWF